MVNSPTELERYIEYDLCVAGTDGGHPKLTELILNTTSVLQELVAVIPSQHNWKEI